MQKGYTLIELMIAVAIIGVLAAVAIVAYVDAVTRARLAEAIALSAPVKLAMIEYHEANNRWPADNAELSLPEPDAYSTEVVNRLEVAGNRITVTLTDRVRAGGLMYLTGQAADGQILWRCHGSDQIQTLLPASCRD